VQRGTLQDIKSDILTIRTKLQPVEQEKNPNEPSKEKNHDELSKASRLNFGVQAVAAVIMAGGVHGQLIYQARNEENEVTNEIRAGKTTLGCVLVCYLGMTCCGYLLIEETMKKRLAFLARSVFLNLLIPPIKFKDPEQYQSLQLTNFANSAVCTFVAHNFAENPLDLLLSQGISLLGFIARTIQFALLGA